MGRKPKEILQVCIHCGNEYDAKGFYNSSSILYSKIKKMPYCKTCMEKIYQHYLKMYREDLDCTYPEEKAFKRLCMILDAYLLVTFTGGRFDFTRSHFCHHSSTPLLLHRE